ncbi:D(1A) dopamine receptor-like [Schistocerca nitens]|uniref:D(1A) dopamine receptor-like n=1 Tax=Schistocerca nitens TaxID=7011 RepID=UPI002118EF35|nr:D(1A) dopamine receptor-like [Schistocerca nitens]
MNDTDVVLNGTVPPPATEVSGRYSIPEMVLIAIVAGFLSLVTVVGNSMVMISFKIDKQLQTISNYFLFSLAVADLAIGLISMPLFTVSTILGYWPLGPHICDTWLALDYLASNASVLNLLIISFDRYFSVTRPLTYRAKRTTNRAAIMIGQTERLVAQAGLKQLKCIEEPAAIVWPGDFNVTSYAIVHACPIRTARPLPEMKSAVDYRSGLPLALNRSPGGRVSRLTGAGESGRGPPRGPSSGRRRQTQVRAPRLRAAEALPLPLPLPSHLRSTLYRGQRTPT